MVKILLALNLQIQYLINPGKRGEGKCLFLYKDLHKEKTRRISPGFV